MYAILDIETTGGKYNQEGITEIAIYKFDGHTITDQFISLINPERPIQPFVVNLTGINNEMLRNAPKFFEIAKRIVEITENTTLVAHNASFDYRILRTEFDRLGYTFNKQTLCTVELSKKLIPGLPSYSLGKLVKTLGIPLSNRHRASGDAKATVALFKLLLNKDLKKEIIQNNVKQNPRKQIDSKLKNIIDEAPTETGVYYLHNQEGNIIYIGKSKNIKKRITQHFTSDNKKSKKIQLEAASISVDKTGSELIALLKENEEIKVNKPIYNRAQRRSIFLYQLNSFIDPNGYINFKIEKTNSKQKPITTFSNLQQAKKSLFSYCEKYQLCQKLTGLYDTKAACFSYTIKACKGACINKETPEEYNQRAHLLIEELCFQNKSFLIIDKGRNLDEKSLVYIENGLLRGYAFFNLNFQIYQPEILKTLITPIQNNKDALHIIRSSLRNNPLLKVIPIKNEA